MMDEKTAEVLKIEISRLNINEGETLLVRISPDLDPCHVEEMTKFCVPKGVKVMVAPIDAEFSVISSAE